MQAYLGGRADAIAAILDFKRRGRLGRVERATKGEGIWRGLVRSSPQLPKILQIQHGGYDNRDFGTRASQRKRLHCRLDALVDACIERIATDSYTVQT